MSAFEVRSSVLGVDGGDVPALFISDIRTMRQFFGVLVTNEFYQVKKIQLSIPEY